MFVGRVTKHHSVAGPIPQLVFHVRVENLQPFRVWFVPPLCQLSSRQRTDFLTAAPFLGHAWVESANSGFMLDAAERKGASEATWRFALAIDHAMLSALEKARAGGDLILGLFVNLVGFELMEDGTMRPTAGWVADESDHGSGILPYRIAQSDWNQMKRDLGFDWWAIVRRLGKVVGVAGQFRAVWSAIRSFLGS
ncbi:MAG: hypothetical protein EPO26_07360 [Chloroflexota bacterium]|nr:MAG: hypothetical protein EPO26_07360 [Chloroflexota bacterium]